MLDKPLVIAYEPIWAIGTGLTPTTSEIDSTHRFIKTLIKSQFGQNIAVLYGGSVNAKMQPTSPTYPQLMARWLAVRLCWRTVLLIL